MTLASQTTGEFSVYQFFHDGSHECLKSHVGAEEAVETARSFILRPAARIGFIQRVMITDGGDFAVFDWQHGKGVVYPPQEKG